MSSSLRELKSSTIFSKRVGIAAALNYKNALVNSVVSSHRIIRESPGGNMTYPLRNKSQVLQVFNCNRIKVVDSPANQ